MVKASLKKVLEEEVLRRDREIEHLVPDHRPSLSRIEARRALVNESEPCEGDPAPRSTSRVVDIRGREHAVPEWLVTHEFRDEVMGDIKSGKEAEVVLVKRTGANDWHYLALKRYRDPARRKFRRDQIYREGRRIRKSRDQKAITLGTNYGKTLIADQWWGAEFDYLRRLWAAGADVPFAVEMGAGLLMEFIGDDERAAPRLVDIPLTTSEAEAALDRILRNLQLFSREGIVHGDLSAYNVLYWKSEVWVIDFPQAADLTLNPHGFDLLYRDVKNVCEYFARKYRIERQVDEEFAFCVAAAY